MGEVPASGVLAVGGVRGCHHRVAVLKTEVSDKIIMAPNFTARCQRFESRRSAQKRELKQRKVSGFLLILQ